MVNSKVIRTSTVHEAFHELILTSVEGSCDSAESLIPHIELVLQNNLVPGDSCQLDCGKLWYGEVVAVQSEKPQQRLLDASSPESSPGDKENNTSKSTLRYHQYTIKLNGMIVRSIPAGSVKRIDDSKLPSREALIKFLKAKHKPIVRVDDAPATSSIKSVKRRLDSSLSVENFTAKKSKTSPVKSNKNSGTLESFFSPKNSHKQQAESQAFSGKTPKELKNGTPQVASLKIRQSPRHGTNTTSSTSSKSNCKPNRLPASQLTPKKLVELTDSSTEVRRSPRHAPKDLTNSSTIEKVTANEKSQKPKVDDETVIDLRENSLDAPLSEKPDTSARRTAEQLKPSRKKSTPGRTEKPTVSLKKSSRKPQEKSPRTNPSVSTASKASEDKTPTIIDAVAIMFKSINTRPAPDVQEIVRKNLETKDGKNTTPAKVKKCEVSCMDVYQDGLKIGVQLIKTPPNYKQYPKTALSASKPIEKSLLNCDNLSSSKTGGPQQFENQSETLINKRNKIVLGQNMVNGEFQDVEIVGEQPAVKKKQMTLFDMAKNSVKQLEGDKFEEITPPTPRVVRKYRKALKDNNLKAQGKCILQASKQLTEKQVTSLPTPIKELVLQKQMHLKKRAEVKSMSEEEKKEYLKQQRAKAPSRHQPTYAEDTHLKSQPLPPAIELTLPSVLHDVSVGDVLCIVQFVRSFDKFLICSSEGFKSSTFTKEKLLNGLQHPTRKGSVVTPLLISFLQTLLQDVTMNEAVEMRVPLKDFLITEHSVSNILSIVFRQYALRQEELKAGDNIIQQLQCLADELATKEFTELTSPNIVKCLLILSEMLLDTQSIIDHQDRIQRQLNSASKLRMDAFKEYSDFEKEYNTFKEVKAGEKLENDASIPVVEAESVADALKLRSRLAKQSADQRLKRQAAEKEEQEYAAKRDRLIHAKMAAENKYSDALYRLRLTTRNLALGQDRDHRKYWLMPGVSGIVVEQGWTDKEYYYNVYQPNTDIINVEDPKQEEERILERVPAKVEAKWSQYIDRQSVDALMKALNGRGYREYSLIKRLRHRLHDIKFKAVEEQSSAEECSGDSMEVDEGQDSPVLNAAKSAVLDLENRIRSAGLGGLARYDIWSEKVNSASNIQSLGLCLLECQDAIFANRLTWLFTLPEAIPSKSEGESSSVDSSEFVTNENLEQWRSEVNQVKSASRLHVLLDILNLCVSWDKSVENAKCKVCRRKGKDSELLLCDGCDGGFHMGCIRLLEIPEGDWFCPTCKPPERRNHSSKSLKELSGSEDDDESESEVEEELCEVCNQPGPADLVICDSCFSTFHIQCVTPPLRSVPKLTWTCHSCRNVSQSKPARSEKAPKDKETSSADDTEDSATKATARGKQSRKPTRGVTRRTTRAASTESSSEDEMPTSRRSSRGQTTPRSASLDPGSDSETEENPHQTKTRKSSGSSSRRSKSQRTKNSGGRGRAKSTSKNDSSDLENATVKKKPGSLTTIDSFFKSRKPLTSEQQLEIIEFYLDNGKDNQPPAVHIQACRTILRKILSCRFSWPFEHPVDRSEVPDYYTVIKNPIDLELIDKKLDGCKYKSAAEFIKDFSRLLFNSFDYNTKGDQISLLTQKLENYFHMLITKHLSDFQYDKQQALFGYTDSD